LGALRAILILLMLALVTPAGMLLQAVLLRVSRRGAAWLPVMYHRFVCRLLGVRIDIRGQLAAGRPLLITANHSSWLDIPVFSAVAPLSFIAKREVAGWPVVGWLARLQRTIFVDRERRSRTGEVNRTIASRLAEGDVMVLFAEGTSSDGNRVLPFRSALIGAVHDVPDRSEDAPALLVQPVAIAYLQLNGLPMGRQHRPLVAWHGDVELAPHVWRLLTAGTIDVVVAFGEPIALGSARQRKEVATRAEQQVRAMLQALVSGRTPCESVPDT
jgi:lyso-ornithine lipid O-acyltransferase